MEVCVAKRRNVRQVVLYRGEDGYWVAEVPSLPGCISQGETKEQALENARDAIAGYVAVLEEDGLTTDELQARAPVPH
jgi:predicted RNase H-like HicB family nuclease